MSEENGEISESASSKWVYARWILLRITLIVYDILSVNASVYLALITRFYVAKEFHTAAAQNFEAYNSYALFYTVFCVLVFAAFKLYSGIWKYAGFNDLNRILAANAVVFACHVAGTILFGIRMPITIYCISGVILLCLVTASRFAYRLLLVERDKLAPHRASLNALLVGTGGTARNVMKQLERESVVRPACMLNYKENGFGTLFDGVPVVSGVENLKSAIEKYRINLVVLASTVIPKQIRNQIKEICGELNVEVQDYSGYFQSTGNGVVLRNLAECCDGAVEILINGQYQHFDDCEQAMMNTAGEYVVKSISVRNGHLLIELADKQVLLNDLNADWIKAQKQATGEDVSFF